MRKIAIANRKFEVRNIITAVNVAAGLAAADYKFLLVDTDIQGHYSKLLGINPEKDSVELIVGIYMSSEAIIEAREGFYLLMGDKSSLIHSLAGIQMIIISLEPLHHSIYTMNTVSCTREHKSCVSSELI